MARSMVGFDIGACELKIVQWDGSKLRKTVIVPTPDNLVKNGQIVSYEAMADLIRETAKEHRIRCRNAAVILPSTHAFLRRITTPAMTVDQLAVNLPYEFRDFLTMEKDKYFYDYAVNEIVRNEDGTPSQLDLTACAIPKQVIEDYRSMFRRAGFKLKTAIPVECAYANLVAALSKIPDRELCLIDLGHTSTRVHILVDGCFETSRVIEKGFNLLDQAIADAKGVDEHIAHTYLLSNHENVQELEGPVNLYQSIAMDIRKTVNFYGFDHRDSNLQNAWCIGGGVEIPAMMDTLRQTLELTLHTSQEAIPDYLKDHDSLGAFAAAIGAAIQ